MPFNEAEEVIVGYYHILAQDMNEAIAIARGNPEVDYTPSARIEVRLIKKVRRHQHFCLAEGQKSSF